MFIDCKAIQFMLFWLIKFLC